MLERKYLAHFIDAEFDKTGENTNYVRLGADLEELNVELNPSIETSKNILGESSVLISGYEKTAAVEPFYAQAGSQLFERLQAIIDGDLVLDELKADVVDVKLWDESEAGGYPAVKEAVYIEVTSYGGDTTGYQIPFTIHYTGEKVKGTFNVATRTFTAA